MIKVQRVSEWLHAPADVRGRECEPSGHPRVRASCESEDEYILTVEEGVGKVASGFAILVSESRTISSDVASNDPITVRDMQLASVVSSRSYCQSLASDTDPHDVVYRCNESKGRGNTPSRDGTRRSRRSSRHKDGIIIFLQGLVTSVIVISRHTAVFKALAYIGPTVYSLTSPNSHVAGV